MNSSPVGSASPPSSSLETRVGSLWRLSLRLKRLASEGEPLAQLTGREARDIEQQLDALCDEVERLIWHLSSFKA